MLAVFGGVFVMEAERGVVNSSYVGRIVVGLFGEAKCPLGDERSGWRCDHIFWASVMAFWRMKCCLGCSWSGLCDYDIRG